MSRCSPAPRGCARVCAMPPATRASLSPPTMWVACSAVSLPREQDVGNYSQVMACDSAAFNRFFHLMLEHGVYLAPGILRGGLYVQRPRRGRYRTNYPRGSQNRLSPVFDRGIPMTFTTERGPFPQTRMRRLRANDFARRLVRENATDAGRFYLSGICPGG